jgi:serine/threonine protein kinase/formylglycine-generating enzyme required for sulfatase activity
MNPPPPTSDSDADLDYGPTLRGLRAGWKVFERYTLVRQLGRGGMGVVWLAQDEKLDLDIALKFLPEDMVHDEIALDDLRRETKRCMRLTHQHIVHVYDFVSDEDRAAIAMEFVDGKSLSALRLEQPGKVFEVEQLRALVRQVCEALTYAHEQGRLVHYDLKPGNLMLTGGGLVKVMDFGIAASIHDSASRQSRARSTAGMGTLHYMSPQQLGGYPPAVGDDVYSLGATMYELLSGRPPFHGFRDRALEEQIQHTLPPSLAQRRAELAIESTAAIPPLWEQTIAACLEKEVDKRPQSVAEVWQRLSGEAVGRSVSTPAAQPPVREPVSSPVSNSSSQIPYPSSPVTRSRKPVLIALAVLLIAGSGAGWWIKVEAPRRAEAARIEQERLEEEERLRLAEEARRKKEAEDAAEAARLAKEKADAEEKQKQMAEIARLAKEKADAEEKMKQMAEEVERKRLEEESRKRMSALADMENKARNVAAELARLPQAGADFKSSSGMLLKWVAPLRAWVGATEVTQDEFVRVMGTNPSSIKGSTLPVNSVTWNEAQQFCRMLTSQDKTVFGQGFHFAYQLPGDSDYTVYVEGTKLSDSVTSVGSKRSRPAPVASSASNAYGLYDVRGNVWEWLADRFDRSMNSSSTNARLANGLSSQGRVLRGGSFTTSEDAKLDINTRASDREDQRDETCGFRVILRPGN